MILTEAERVRRLPWLIGAGTLNIMFVLLTFSGSVFILFLDEIGLDTAWHVTHVFKDEKSKKFSKLLKEYIDVGKLGKKVGQGFYTYPNPRFQDADFIKG